MVTEAPGARGSRTVKAGVIHGIRDVRVEDRRLADPGPLDVVVRMTAVTICGSDLHYYRHAVSGTFAIQAPFVLGHEGAGVVERVGDDVTSVKRGDAVAINPGRACGLCRWCRSGRPNLCKRMRYMGSAGSTPHVDGLLVEFATVTEQQCFAVPRTLKPIEVAMIEPLAVAIHAARRAGYLFGKCVLIVGSGPVGLLLAQVVAMSGATVVISDVNAARRDTARTLGVGTVVDGLALELDEHLARLDADGFDVVFEATGASAAVAEAIPRLVRGGVWVQVGNLPKDVLHFSGAMLMVNEVDIRGSFRFLDEFDAAVSLMSSGRVRTDMITTHVFPFAELREAFAFAEQGGVPKVGVTFEPDTTH